ncbi:uncharacterized protein LOC131929628 [Physella acuta]|uniref:uncharacterized protein LOC131929628 n=1 Tax=Physella acuta TaxID=109671 RepID=UPI0027DB3F56|nr:uncharacterized protein LOC131929628 [Physella acuta]
MMTMGQTVVHKIKRLMILMALPRVILPVFVVIIFASTLTYLMWANPASVVSGDQYMVQPVGVMKGRVQERTRFTKNHLVENGYGAWIDGRDIEVMSAIHDIHYSNTSSTRIVLPSFLRHSKERDFVCCFHTSLHSDEYYQVQSSLDFIDLRFIVNFQNAAFECLLDNSMTDQNRKFKYVAFAPESCEKNVSSSVRVVYPRLRSWEFAVCTKVAYGRLDPARLVEWFEFLKWVGCSKVLTFYNNVHPDSMKVFLYYQSTGLLDFINYRPLSLKGATETKFTENNSQTRQARQDKTLVVRDCQYRLGGYDFVMTVDFDELPVPVRPFGSLNWVFQDLLLNNTDAGAFRMDPVLLPPEWKSSRSNLFHWQFSAGTYITPYCRKWVYIPKRTWLAATHENVPKNGYKKYVIPNSALYFLHFRSCKPDWLGVPCQNLTQTVKNLHVLDRFSGMMYLSMNKLPLEELIPDTNYVNFIRSNMKSSAAIRKRNFEIDTQNDPFLTDQTR